MSSHKNNVVITGANGLLGNSLVNILKDNYLIHALVHQIPSVELNNVNYHKIDFNSIHDLCFLPKNIDAVIHLAQSGEFKKFPESGLDVFNVNIRSTALLLDYCYKNNVKNFILASSGAVYEPNEDPVDESSSIINIENIGNYPGSKLCSEIITQNYSNFFNIKILRFFFIYGPNQKESFLIPRLIKNIANENPISLQGDEGIKLNPIYVVDAAKAVAKCLELYGNHVINVAGPEILSIHHISCAIGNLVGKSAKFSFIDENVKNYIANINKMEILLHRPSIHFDEGIRRIIDE